MAARPLRCFATFARTTLGMHQLAAVVAVDNAALALAVR